MVTADAAIQMAAQRGRPALGDSPQHPAVVGREPGAVRRDEALAVRSHDVGHLKGWRPHRFCSRRERRACSGGETGIVSNGFATAVRCRRERWR